MTTLKELKAVYKCVGDLPESTLKYHAIEFLREAMERAQDEALGQGVEDIMSTLSDDLRERWKNWKYSHV